MYSGAGQQLWWCALKPPASFIIPTLNESATIAATLERLALDYPEAECLVVDGGSTDDTVQRVDDVVDALEISARVLHSEPGRARQMNAGAQAATGNYLVFFHADTRPPGSPRSLLTVLQAGPAWGFAAVKLTGDGWMLRIIERFMSWRSRLTRVATGDQMLFVRADLFDRLGGFADIPLMEDVELSKRLRRESAPSIITDPVETSSRRWRERGVLRTVLTMWSLRLAYFCGVHPRRLWRYYYGDQ